MVRRAVRHFIALCVVAILLTAAATGGLIWRLKQGPLLLPNLAEAAADHLSDHQRGLFIKIENLVLALSDDLIDGHGRLEIRALNVAVAAADGRTLATVPEAALDLSATALLGGAARPTRVELIRPRVAIIRRADGGFGFNVGGEAGDASQPAPHETPDNGAAAGDSTGDSTGVADELLAALAHPADAGPILGLLRMLAVRDGDLTLVDEGRALRWRANPATLVLQRGAEGVDGLVKLALETPAGAAPLEGTLKYDQTTGTSRATATFSNIRPAATADMAADLAPLRGLDLPLKGRLDVQIGRDFRIVSADFAAGGDSGTVTIPVGEKDRRLQLDVQSFDASGRYEAAGRRLTVADAGLRIAGGVVVQAAGEVALRPDGTARPRGRAAVQLDHVEPARLTAAALSPLIADMKTPLTGTATIDVGDDDLALAADMTLGAGTLGRLDGLFAEPLRVRGGHVAATATLNAQTFAPKAARVKSLSLDVDGPRLDVAADLTVQDGRAALKLDAGLTHVSIADLPRLWPPKAGRKPRDWVLENMLDGAAPKIVASAALSAPLSDPSDISPDKITAQIVIENGTVRYFRPLPPATKIARAVADFDGKDFVIKTHGGEVAPPDGGEPVRAGDGLIHIFNVGSPREDLTVDIGLTGPLRSMLTILDMPPLGYPSKLDINPANTAGHVDGRLKIAFPLFDSVKLDDLDVQVSAKAAGAAIQKVVAGRNATDGELTVDLDTHAMTVTGKARFDGAPITLNWREVFDAKVKGPGTVLEAQGRSDVRHLSTFGPDILNDYARGPVDAKVRYVSGENRQATLNVALDLAPSDIDVNLINWRKPPGTAAQSRFVLHFKDGKPTRISDLRLDGAGMQAAATVLLAAGGGEVARIDAARIKTGATDMAAAMTRAKDGSYQVKLTGAAYDLRGALKDDPPEKAAATAEKNAAKPPPPMTIDMQLGRLLFGDNRGISDVEGRLRRENGDWAAINLRGRTPPKGELSIRLDGPRNGGQLSIDADNAGAALSALDVTDRVRGGVLKVRGQSPVGAAGKTEPPIDGAITMTDYMLVDAPALARILNAMSVTGLAELLSGEGIGFGDLTGSFRKQGDRLRLRDVRTAGGALGLTMEGDIDLARDTAKLNGTIVPIYTFNRIIGQIPLLGDLLSGGPGQGIFAATWTVDGPLSDPKVSVNPLALLTPGFLRNLFFSGDGSRSGSGSGETGR